MNNSEIKLQPKLLLSIVASCTILVYVFYGSIESMVMYWYGHEEFGHAFLLPFISFYLICQKRHDLYLLPTTNTWLGLLIVLMGILLFLIGRLGAVYTIQQYAFVFVLIGMFVTIFGVEVSKKVSIPLLLLLFMIPLPGFLYNTLSGKLQLISSELGVFVIRLFDISVYLEGNVIDLGVYKLQVVEACNGLRYLFPLMALGLIASYIYKSTIINKIIVFLSSMPITVFMNSFRIGVIGVLVEYYGISMAEGFLHDFEGWIVFMACLVILFIEMWLLNYIVTRNTSFSDIFDLEVIDSKAESAGNLLSKASKMSIIILPIMIFTLVLTFLSDERETVYPERSKFVTFPIEIGGYYGKSGTFEPEIIDALNFDDYLTADFIKPSENDSYNIYVAYYDTQKADKVPHSPKACLPGGGWTVLKSDVIKIMQDNTGNNIFANRVVIDKKGRKQLVYYWFKQRDRNVTSEYLVKWYLLVDSISKGRTDGSLVRFVTQMKDHEELEQAEHRMKGFISTVYPVLKEYLPD